MTKTIIETGAQKEARAFALRMTDLGFPTYIAEAGDYGFVTDDNGSRVVTFGFCFGGRLGGTYGPPSRESGTGWGLNIEPHQLTTKEEVKRALYSQPAPFAGWRWRYLCTFDNYMDVYNRSSKFVLYERTHTPEA